VPKEKSAVAVDPLPSSGSDSRYEHDESHFPAMHQYTAILILPERNSSDVAAMLLKSSSSLNTFISILFLWRASTALLANRARQK
jgi:hypothetical protein